MCTQPFRARRAYRAEVAAALKAHRDCPRVLHAIERTALLLQYESHASPAARWFSSRIRDVRIRKHGTSPGSPYRGRYPRHSPRTMLARVLEHYAMVSEQASRFPDANAEHEALGRAFMLTSKGAHTARDTWYRAADRYIAQELASFCIPFIRDNLAPLLDAENNTHEES